jgi:hypothetical protein
MSDRKPLLGKFVWFEHIRLVDEKRLKLCSLQGWTLRGRATNIICSCGDPRRHGFDSLTTSQRGAKTAWFKDTEGNTMAISQVLWPGGPPMRRARPPTTDVMYLLVSAPRPSACRVLVVGFLVRPTGTEEH